MKVANTLVSCRRVGVTLGAGAARVNVLRDVDLDVREGEAVVLWGRSGSGKSTLLNVLGGLLTPSSGAVDWPGMPPATAASAYGGRRGSAVVFQSAKLLPHFSVYENVAFAVRSSAAGDGAGADDAPDPMQLLRLVGLEAKAGSLPAELSGGEQQRVAIARALAQRPRLLLCDEPTGHLDSDTGTRVLALIRALHDQLGFALVLATHDADVAAQWSREVELLDGHIVRDQRAS
jgi:putative ABC transport system ATP-binding protein